MRRSAFLAALLALPVALAQAGGDIDATLTLAPDAEPVVEGPPGLVRVVNATPGERYELALTLPREYTTLEVRARGFDLERPRQLVPSLVVPETQYPLFVPFPHARIWEVDGPANVFFVEGTGDDLVLRLGVAGPRNVTLVLERDVEPPAYTLGEVQNVTHTGFYQETRTEELALADLQVRRVGETEWVHNPTPEYHVLQRFPIQGLDADADHEARVVFEDWAGNNATSATYAVRTLPAPVGPAVVVRPISPVPNSTILPGTLLVRAAIESPESPVPPHGVRLFFDLREVKDGIEFGGGEVRYAPDTVLAAGLHRVSVEATNEAGGRGEARWSFTVQGEEKEAPGIGAWPLLALAVALALARRR